MVEFPRDSFLVISSVDMVFHLVRPFFPLSPSQLLVIIVTKRCCDCEVECRILSCTGDNPATLLSFSLLSSDVVVSLGTSDTILLSTVDYVPNIESHTFSYPANMLQKGEIDSQGGKGKRSYMGMLCYKKYVVVLFLSLSFS